jgi:predicted DNA binding CopG/RHH family protein
LCPVGCCALTTPYHNTALAKQAAKEYLSKSKNITLRLNIMDLKGIKAKSKELGIPYQTIIGVLVHQYVDGKVKLAQ